MVSLAEVITDVASEATATAAARSVRIDLDVPARRPARRSRRPRRLDPRADQSGGERHPAHRRGMTVRLIGRPAEDGRVQVAGGRPLRRYPRGEPAPGLRHRMAWDTGPRAGTTAVPDSVWPSPAGWCESHAGRDRASATSTAAAALRLTCRHRPQPGRPGEGPAHRRPPASSARVVHDSSPRPGTTPWYSTGHSTRG